MKKNTLLFYLGVILIINSCSKPCNNLKINNKLKNIKQLQIIYFKRNNQIYLNVKDWEKLIKNYNDLKDNNNICKEVIKSITDRL